MTDLDELQRRVVAFREERDWKQFHNPKDMAISLALAKYPVDKAKGKHTKYTELV